MHPLMQTIASIASGPPRTDWRKVSAENWAVAKHYYRVARDERLAAEWQSASDAERAERERDADLFKMLARSHARKWWEARLQIGALSARAA